MLDYAASTTTRIRPRRAERGRAVSFVRKLDWVLVVAVAGLVGFGLWAIAGITRQDVLGNPNYYVLRQGFYAVLGGVGLIAALLVDPHLYRRHRRWLYGLMLVLLVLVLAAGSEARGSQRWLDIGFFRFQPSEFGKLLLILFLAGFLADRGRRIAEARTMLLAVALAAVPMLLVYLQPDVGTTLVYGSVLAAALFVAGARWKHLAVLAGGASLVAATVLWFAPALEIQILRPYQAARLTAFTNPSDDPSGAGYNISQSITAVGSGGLNGRGVEGATQTNLNYLPEHATDFAFASLAEQRGFVGASILLCLYLLLIWRGMKVVAGARDAFSATVAGAIVFTLLFQVFVNVGMTIGIAPITGIPLPFVSAGGSSMITNLVAVGVLQAIWVRRR